MLIKDGPPTGAACRNCGHDSSAHSKGYCWQWVSATVSAGFTESGVGGFCACLVLDVDPLAKELGAKFYDAAQ